MKLKVTQLPPSLFYCDGFFLFPFSPVALFYLVFPRGSCAFFLLLFFVGFRVWNRSFPPLELFLRAVTAVFFCVDFADIPMMLTRLLRLTVWVRYCSGFIPLILTPTLP